MATRPTDFEISAYAGSAKAEVREYVERSIALFKAEIARSRAAMVYFEDELNRGESEDDAAFRELGTDYADAFLLVDKFKGWKKTAEERYSLDYCYFSNISETKYLALKAAFTEQYAEKLKELTGNMQEKANAMRAANLQFIHQKLSVLYRQSGSNDTSTLSTGSGAPVTLDYERSSAVASVTPGEAPSVGPAARVEPTPARPPSSSAAP